MDSDRWAMILPAGIFVVLGLVFLLMVRKIAEGTFERNRFAGIRTPATMRSDAAWKAGHRAAQPQLLLGAVVLLIGGVVIGIAAVLDLPPGFGAAATLVTVGALLVAVLYGAVKASKAAARV